MGGAGNIGGGKRRREERHVSRKGVIFDSELIGRRILVGFFFRGEGGGLTEGMVFHLVSNSRLGMIAKRRTKDNHKKKGEGGDCKIRGVFFFSYSLGGD